jgi:hypothetical protein
MYFLNFKFFFFKVGEPFQGKPQSRAPHPGKFFYTKLVKLLAFLLGGVALRDCLYP